MKGNLVPARRKKLEELVGQLEAELLRIDAVDDDTRTLLENTASEIQSALAKSDPAGFEPQTWIDQLKRSTEEFETSHPTLSGVLARIVDVLGQMGI